MSFPSFVGLCLYPFWSRVVVVFSSLADSVPRTSLPCLQVPQCSIFQVDAVVVPSLAVLSVQRGGVDRSPCLIMWWFSVEVVGVRTLSPAVLGFSTSASVGQVPQSLSRLVSLIGSVLGCRRHLVPVLYPGATPTALDFSWPTSCLALHSYC